ncbi:MAG: SDR family oxidoreductase [Christensenellales bacterium]
MKTLSGELADKGIRANAIAPGFTDTPMPRKAVESDIPASGRRSSATRRWGCHGDPMDIGRAAVYLTSRRPPVRACACR